MLTTLSSWKQNGNGKCGENKAILLKLGVYGSTKWEGFHCHLWEGVPLFIPKLCNYNDSQPRLMGGGTGGLHFFLTEFRSSADCLSESEEIVEYI